MAELLPDHAEAWPIACSDQGGCRCQCAFRSYFGYLAEWSEECAEEKVGSSEKMSINATGSASSAPKNKALPGAADAKGGPGLVVNYDQVCNSSRGLMKRQIKELEKLSSKLRFLDTIQCSNDFVDSDS